MRAALSVLRDEAAALPNDPHTVELVMRNADFGEELAREWLRHVRWKVERPEPETFTALVATLRALELVPAHGPVRILADRGT
jgi:hypothetical protein